MSEATYSPSTGLRMRLENLERERGDHSEAGKELSARIGDALLEARETPHLTLTEACELVGLSRPSGYQLIYEAEKRARRPADDMDRADGLGT
jgi:hypothetical protein